MSSPSEPYQGSQPPPGYPPQMPPPQAPPKKGRSKLLVGCGVIAGLLVLCMGVGVIASLASRMSRVTPTVVAAASTATRTAVAASNPSTGAAPTVKPTQASQAQQPSAAAVAALPGLNVPVTSKNWQMIVQSAKTFDELDLLGKTKPLGTFLVVQVEMTNIGSQNYGVNEHDFKLKDSTGFVYKTTDNLGTSSYNKSMGGAGIGGQVPGGVPVKYYLVYDVAPSATGLQMVFDQDKKPAVALDVTIQTKKLDTHPPIGQPVKTKNWQVTVVSVQKSKTLDMAGTKTALGTFLVVEVEVQNFGKENFGVNTADFVVKGGTFTYKPTDNLGVGSYNRDQQGNDIGGQVPHSVVARYFLIYDVSPDVTGLQLVFTQDQKPTIDLGQ